MANVPETSTWESGVYQFETSDIIQGGSGGIDNLPHQQLGNRTKWLYDNKVGTGSATAWTMAGAYTITGQVKTANGVSYWGISPSGDAHKMLELSTAGDVIVGDVGNTVGAGTYVRAKFEIHLQVDYTSKLVLTSSGVLLGAAPSASDNSLAVVSSSWVRGYAAPIVSPTFTGVPSAPTAAQDTNSSQLATTRFVIFQATNDPPLMDGAAAVGDSYRYARSNHVHPTDTTRAPVDSPTLTGLARYQPTSDSAFEIGFRSLPGVSPSAGTILASYNGKILYNVAGANGGPGTMNIPTGLPAGMSFYIYNNTPTETIWLTASAGVSLELAGSGYSGPVSIPRRRLAKVIALSSVQFAVVLVGAPRIGATEMDFGASGSDAVEPGYVAYEGQVVLRATYAMLFAKLGTRYNTGGELSTEFRLPDTRGQFPRFWDNGRGLDPDSSRALGSTQSDQFKLHGHPVMYGVGNANTDQNGGLAMDQDGAQQSYTWTGSPTSTRGQQVGGAGGDETRPTNIAIRLIAWAGY